MFINANVDKIVSDGFERYIRISTYNDLFVCLWCYFIDTEDSSTDNGTINVGQELALNLSIEWVNNYTFLGNGENTSYTQTIKESPHIEAIASIVSVVDEYTLICDVGNFKGITVEFESKHKNISIGDVIKFTGNLKAELI